MITKIKKFAEGEFYHIFNRGNNKRPVFLDKWDLHRFFISMKEFNTEKPIGSIFENSFKKDISEDRLGSSTSKLVEFISYCLNPNHYHILVRQVAPDGVLKLMHRVGTGYTKYFNERHKFSGALFQGRYKSVHVGSNEYLLHLSCYVNLNYRVHRLGSSTSKYLYKSSWDEYAGKNKGICDTSIILDQFKNRSNYEEFAADSLKISQTRKDMEKLLLEEV